MHGGGDSDTGLRRKDSVVQPSNARAPMAQGQARRGFHARGLHAPENWTHRTRVDFLSLKVSSSSLLLGTPRVHGRILIFNRLLYFIPRSAFFGILVSEGSIAVVRVFMKTLLTATAVSVFAR